MRKRVTIQLLFLSLVLAIFSHTTWAKEINVEIFKSDRQQINSYRVLADEASANKSYAKAIEYYKKSLNGLKKTDELELIEVYNDIGDCYLNIGITAEALDYTLKALQLSEKRKDTLNISNSLNSLGAIKIHLKDYHGALNSLHKALDFIKKRSDDSLRPLILNNIGVSYGFLNQLDKSLQYFNKSLILKRKTGDSNKIISGLNNIGYTYQTKGNIALALSYFKQAIELGKNTSQTSELVYTYGALGDLYLSTKDYEKAIVAVTQSLNIAEKQGSFHLMEESYMILAEVYKGLRNFEKSLEYHELYIKTHNKIQSNESIRQIAELRTIYEIDQKEKKIKLLQKDNQLKEVKLANSERTLFISIVVLALISLFALIIFINYKKLKKANTDLVRVNLDVVASQKKRKSNKESRTISTFPEKLKIDSKESSEFILKNEQKELIITKILDLFEEEKVFLEQDLSLVNLSERIETNKSYVSKVINEFSGKNFNSFVNEYRVNEARKLLTEEKYWNYTIESIANMVGFKSKSAFNLAFKKFTGITPSYFLSSIKPNNA